MAEVAANVQETNNLSSPDKALDQFDQKLQEQDRILDETHGEGGGGQGSIHHDDLRDNGEFDADAAKVKTSAVYRYLMNHLSCMALEEQPAFIKLRQRVL